MISSEVLGRLVIVRLSISFSFAKRCDMARIANSLAVLREQVDRAYPNEGEMMTDG
jgi:hypothetical protein